MRSVDLRPRAAYDIESIVTYIAIVLKAPRAAEDWYADLRTTLDLLCEQPEIGREFCDEHLHIQQRRTFLVGNYRLFYSFNAEHLTVWRVLHTSQNMDDYALVDLQG